MKKIIALLMVCGFAFAFVACGGGANKEAESTETPATEETAPAVEETPAPVDSAAVSTDSTATQQ